MERKKLTCAVCGMEFLPMASKKYTVGKRGGLFDFSPVRYFDAFDCPQCGCQVIGKERLACVEEEEDKEDEIANPSELVYSVKDILYDDKEDALAVVHWINAVHATYGLVTVAEYMEFTDAYDSIPKEAYKFGWEDLEEMAVLKSKTGWILHMPPAKRLDVKEHTNE